jgi:hypothetical protein
MAKKGTKKKTAKKKAAKKTSAQKPKTIKFRCISHTCKPSPASPSSLGRASVTLAAPDTRVTIDFTGFATGSPFSEGDHFVIQAGKSRTVHVKSSASGHYPYDLHCDNCGQIVAPPEMIVP